MSWALKIQYMLSQKSQCLKRNGKRAAGKYGVIYALGRFATARANQETLLRRQMFSSLAARETYISETNFPARQQKMFLPEAKINEVHLQYV